MFMVIGILEADRHDPSTEEFGGEWPCTRNARSDDHSLDFQESNPVKIKYSTVTGVQSENRLVRLNGLYVSKPSFVSLGCLFNE
jgi:hypothetical protein